MHPGKNSGRAGVIRSPADFDPKTIFDSLSAEPYSFFLDSALPSARFGRYSFMGSRPFLVFKARGRQWSVRQKGRTVRGRGDPFEALKRLVASYRLDPHASSPPLLAGAVGFVCYESNRLLERLAGPRPPGPGLPDVCFAFYESLIAFDGINREAWICSGGLNSPSGGMKARQEARARTLAAKLREGIKGRAGRRTAAGFRLTTPLVSNMSRGEYERSVGAIKEAIARGDIYQANFTQQFSADWAGDPYDLYARLRLASPAPFAAYLNFDRVKLLSSSPERFLYARGSKVETRPIKGTRPRRDSPEEDKQSALELLKSSKDMAEHVMIVDLERNDLGRVSTAGSVRVTEMAALEMYPQVFHLTSTVEGRLRRGLTAVDALRAMFPGGSITGAPKIKSMDILSGLESSPRGVYTGALGYLGFSGSADLSIVIRTICLAGGRMNFGVGGGIVADSDPAMEYEESLDKAGGMLKALGVESRLGGRTKTAPGLANRNGTR